MGAPVCIYVCIFVHIHSAIDSVLNNFITFVRVSLVWPLRRVIMILTTIISLVDVAIVGLIINCAQSGISVWPRVSLNDKCWMRANIRANRPCVR